MDLIAIQKKFLKLLNSVFILLRVNGIYSPELIRLGEFMHRPDSIPFRICVRSFE
jgi:hypothetical protein